MTHQKTSSHGGVFGENEKVLQAVVLADSFNERFMPLTLDQPRCLLPLVNVPIIEYTIEFLAVSGVQEVILFCRAHADQIKQYISKSRWSKPTSSVHIQILMNSECTSVGDALRDIDARSIIHGDFILVCGDVVSNMNLSHVLALHKKRRQHDKNFIMTMILKEATPFHRTRERCESGLFAIDQETGECIAYELIESESLPSTTISLSRLASLKEVSIRYDLMDCQVDICTPNVLALFTENFDYQDVRRDFVRGVLTLDILGVKLATHILCNEYAARIRSPHLYDSISRDIVERWVFPIVPEADIVGEHAYTYKRGNRYIGPEVVLSRSASIGKNVVLGGGVTVGENSTISSSVIGPNCHIGSDVHISSSYIWENARIEGGARIYGSIVADNVRVQSGTVINRGCLIASNISLGPRAEIPSFTRVVKWGEHIDLAFRQLGISTDQEDFSSLARKHAAILGEGSDGVIWEGNIDGEPDGHLEGSQETTGAGQGCEREGEGEEERKERLWAFEMASDFHQKRPEYGPIESETEEDEEGTEDMESEGMEGEGKYSEQGCSSSSFGHEGAKFFREGVELLKHAIQSDYLVENAILEVNGLKFACNATFHECRHIIITALFHFIDQEELAKSTERHFVRWAPLVHRFTQGMEEELDLIGTVQEACERHAGLERTFQFIIPILYKTDVLDEEAVLQWFTLQDCENSGSLYVRQVRGFVEWLRQADEEDESG